MSTGQTWTRGGAASANMAEDGHSPVAHRPVQAPECVGRSLSGRAVSLLGMEVGHLPPERQMECFTRHAPHGSDTLALLMRSALRGWRGSTE